MCGISVVITPEKNIEKEILVRMNDVISHRGPDGEGFFYDNEAGVGLGHRRLSIIDLTDAGAQPMHWMEKYVITYNGEIYNYIEIRQELIKQGYFFKSHSDTEVILAAYDYWGLDCFPKFNGMWAICLYDKANNKVVLSRDRFGVKPLYYFNCKNGFYASSEIKQLLTTGFVQRKPNYEVLLNFLVLSLVEQDQQTFFESIYSLPPSHNLIYDLQKNEFVINQYYQLQINQSVRKLNETDAIVGYHNIFLDSIRLRLRSDVKVGTCLSGGLDSSYIATIAASLNKEITKVPFIGITASSLDPKNDEVKWAKIVADAAEINLHVIQPTKEDFETSIKNVVYCQEEPFTSPSIIMQHFVMAKAAKLKCTVLLDGQGGDETLLGYERYYIPYINGLSFINKIISFNHIRKNSKLKISDIFLYYLYFNNLFVRKLVSKFRHKFIKKEFIEKVNWGHLKNIVSAYKNIDKNQSFEIAHACLPHLLKFEDRNSMWHSIETRLPFIDYRLVEFAHSINPTIKIKDGWTKYVLRKGTNDILPDAIRWRKIKFGFESPDKIWLKDKNKLVDKISNSPLLNSMFEKKFDAQDNLEILWRYYSVALWEEEFNIVL
jgi:asparagine synthase (glutamine-hydrolysing)